MYISYSLSKLQKHYIFSNSRSFQLQQVVSSTVVDSNSNNASPALEHFITKRSSCKKGWYTFFFIFCIDILHINLKYFP